MKASEIRPTDLMAGQQAAALQDAATLLSRRATFVEVPCPACGSPARTFCYEKYGMQHHRCDGCSTQYVSPRPPPEVLHDFYRNSANYRYFAETVFPASEAARRERLFRPRAQAIAEMARALALGPDAGLVEVGAGFGLFCEEVAKLGLFCRILAIEPTPALASVCRSKGLAVIEAPIEEVTTDERFDVLVSFEVIEHLFSPETFLAACRRLLRPGGHVLLTCPNILGFDTLTLGRASSAVDYEHLNYFNPGSLRLLLERTGFTDVRITTPGQLDLDLVRNAIRSGSARAADIGPFLAHLIAAEDPAADAAFQRFLQDALLSSHMQAIARRI